MWDDKILRRHVLSYLNDGSKDLPDIVAGAGIVEETNFLGIAGRVVGIDPDERVVNNPYLNDGVIGVGESFLFDDGSFDLVIADNVLERLPCLAKVFSEISRALRTGGTFLAKTPNIYHNKPLIASLTPHWFNGWINKKAGCSYEDTFPTRYLVNTPA